MRRGLASDPRRTVHTGYSAPVPGGEAGEASSRESFARRHRFAVGVGTGLVIAAVVLIVVGLTSGATKGTSTRSSTTTASDVRHYAAAAEALCVAMLPEIQRRDRDEHVAYADELAGKISATQMFARFSADLGAIVRLGRLTAREIAVVPVPGSDPPLIRLTQGILRITDAMRGELQAIARLDQAAVKARAAEADRLINADAKLARAAGAPACVL